MSVRIPVAKPELGDAEWMAVREVIQSGWVTQGPRVAAFEEELAQYCGAAYGVAVSSCTAALHVSLIAAGIGPGDEVIVPSMTFIASANAIRHAGATPVFAEIDPPTFNLDIGDAQRRITPQTKAIMLVHQLGLPADIDAFTALADAEDLVLVEDAACAVGSRWYGQPIGSHSNLVSFSFHPRKLLTTGDGGMVMTQDDDIEARLRLLRQHGMSVPDTVRHGAAKVVREQYVEVAYNYRLTDIQAAVGIEQLHRLPELIKERQRLASSYDACLDTSSEVRVPHVPDGADWNVQSYAVRLTTGGVDRRNGAMQDLLDAGIATRAGVMTCHREPAYAGSEAMPVSERASDTSLILPLYPGMTDDEVAEVADRLLAALA